MIDSDSYPLPQVDIPINNLKMQMDLSPLQPNQENHDHMPKVEAVALDKDVMKNLSKAINLIQRIDAKHEIIFEPKYHKEEMSQKFVKLINVLKALQLNLEFFEDVLKSSTEEEIQDLIRRYSPVSDGFRAVTKKENICLVSLNQAFESAIFLVIKQAERATDTFIVVKDDGTIVISTDLEELDHVQIVTSKIEIILDYLPFAVLFKEDNIFCQGQDSETWRKIYEGSEIFAFPDKEGLQNQWKKLYTVLTIANAMVYKSTQSNMDSIKDRFLTVMSGLYYGTNTKEASAKSSLYLCDPKMDSAFQVWNFPEKKWVKEIKKIALPIIDYDKKLYLHRLFPAITRETILKEYEENSSNTILENKFTPPDLVSKKEIILDSIFTKQANAVITRIISPNPLVLKGISSEKARAMAMKAMNKVNEFLDRKKSKSIESADGIIIHVHGGGFVSGSSASHRSYLYRWAKTLNKVIFSIDYRLAPDFPYPAGLDDIWQAYNWIINYAEPLLGIKTDKIIMAGDSAGGNLAMAVTLRAIKMGIRVPDGCFLAYPALNMFPKNFSPSYWQSVEDMMLPCSLLNLCIAAYIPQEFVPLTDPFLSPRVASDELLKRLPPIRIATGKNDPLHDDNWKFLHRMQNLNKDIRMLVYEGMPHAFLSFDNIDEYGVIMEHTYKALNELFSLAEQKQNIINQNQQEEEVEVQAEGVEIGGEEEVGKI